MSEERSRRRRGGQGGDQEGPAGPVGVGRTALFTQGAEGALEGSGQERDGSGSDADFKWIVLHFFT